MKLTKDQRHFWNQNSYLVIKKIFADRVHLMSDWSTEISQWDTDYSKWLTFFERENKSQLSRIENFVPYHAGLNEILNGPTLIGVVSQLLETPAILYKDRINYKLPGGGEHGAHQDGVAYDSHSQVAFGPDEIPKISVLISIDKASLTNGCFQIATGWPLSRLDILQMESPLSLETNYTKIDKRIEQQLDWISIETEPGDIIIFTDRVPHRSGSNHSTKPRRILYGVYNAASEGDKRKRYFDQKKSNINDAQYLVGNPHAFVDINQYGDAKTHKQ